MAEYRCDTVIIGAGPAGMGAAIPLIRNGASVCVIDRATFPRSKTCAGLVTGKTYRLIKDIFEGAVPDDLFCFTSDTVRLFRRTKLLVSAPLEHSVRLVDRVHFDNALVEEYKRLGGVLREGENKTVVDYENSRLTLKNGDVIAYGTILFADGALSMAHRQLKVDKRDLAFGVEVYVPYEQFPCDSVDLYFDYLDNGYAWVFPHGGSVCIGLADVYDKKTEYMKLMRDFLTDLGVSDKSAKFIGAFLPYGTVIPQEKLPDNVMLLGDAGGFTDPISGEGLYMALQSGAYAAEALRLPHPKAAYLDRMAAIIRTVKDGKKVQRTFFSPLIHKVFLKKIEGKTELVTYFFDQMVEEYRCEYRDVKKLISGYRQKDAKT